MAQFLLNSMTALALGGARTPLMDYCGALAEISPIDAGIGSAARGVAEPTRAWQAAASTPYAIAQASFDAYLLPRQYYLYSGVPLECRPSSCSASAAVASRSSAGHADQDQSRLRQHRPGGGHRRSMSRNPICAYTHRSGLQAGQPGGVQGFPLGSAGRPAAEVSMIQTAENLATKYGITRAEVDAFAAITFRTRAQGPGRGLPCREIVPVTTESFELEGYEPRGIKLPRKVTVVDQTHIRAPSPSRPCPAWTALPRRRADGRQFLNPGGWCGRRGGGGLGRAGARGLKPLVRLCGAAAAGVPPGRSWASGRHPPSAPCWSAAG